MKTDWNDEQRLAIETGGRDILVSAAAGSGKTTVLVERIKRLVVDGGVPASSLLVVTFTNAAAREMRNRIRKALEEALKAETEAAEADPTRGSSRREFLRRQLRELPYAHISTFHAFAISVIRRFFHLIDIEPGFKICDESRAFLLKRDALDELMEQEYEAGRPEFLALLDKYTRGRGDENLKDIISSQKGLYEKLMSLPEPDAWAENAVSDLRFARGKLKDTSFWQEYRRELVEALEEAFDLESRAVRLVMDSGLKRIALEYISKELIPIRSALKRLIKNTKPAKTVRDTAAMLAGFKLSQIKGNASEKEAFSEISQRSGMYRDAAKEHIDKVRELCSTPLIEAVTEIKATAPDAEEFFRLVREFRRIYDEKKAAEKLVDFTDQEHLCLKVLSHPEACEALRREISYIFIDEYQDTNLMQETIISRISKPGCTFMVGDIKQSIYRFRLADPGIFSAKYAAFTTADRMESAEGPIAIDMNRNYRSKAPIRSYINRTFDGLMKGYDERAALHGPDNEDKTVRPGTGGPGRGGSAPGEGDEPVLALLDARSAESFVFDHEADDGAPGDYEEIQDLRNDELEAHHIASIIQGEVGKVFRPMKEEGERPLRLRDIAILTRSNFPAQTLRKILNDRGIRCIVNENDGYFDTIEIEVFMSLLSVLDNRQQDIKLLTVLYSEIFGFSAEELARIRAAFPAGSFFSAFVSYGTEGEIPDLREKCAGALALIDGWRRIARVMPLADLIWKLMLDSGYYLITGALPDGGRRQANMRMLCDRAEAYASEGEASLYGFIKYVEALRTRKVKIPEAKLLGDSEDAVRIMTMHKSKGLEFPMVIVSGMSHRLQYENSSEINFHKDLGLGLRNYVEYGREYGTAYRKTVLQKLIVDRIRSEELEEQIRILYVAMTRARDKLYLTGVIKDVEKFAERARTDLRSYTTYLGMISPHCDYRVFNLKFGPYELGGRLPAAPPEHTEAPSPRELTDEEKAALYRQLDYTYPYEAARSIRSKYSVSEINEMLSGETDSGATPEDTDSAAAAGHGNARPVRLAVPNFAAETHRITAAERGTVYHTLMEKLDFTKVPAESRDTAENYVRYAAEDYLDAGLISEEELDVVDPGKIAAFFRSGLGIRAARAAAAGTLRKEHPFTMKLVSKGEDVLVQGIIDCYFVEEEEGGGRRTVLLDYKSNYFDLKDPEGEEKRIRKAYSGQIALYRRALERAGLPPVKEAYLYLFAVGKMIDMTDAVWEKQYELK